MPCSQYQILRKQSDPRSHIIAIQDISPVYPSHSMKFLLQLRIHFRKLHPHRYIRKASCQMRHNGRHGDNAPNDKAHASICPGCSPGYAFIQAPPPRPI